MGKALNNWLKLTKKIDIREESLLNIRVAAHFLGNAIEKVTGKFGITESQYNVLRILMGVYPDGHPRCEIISRMIERAPDITRHIDRLEKSGLVKRDRNGEDRRMSMTKITVKGIKLIRKIRPEIDAFINEYSGKLTKDECKILSELLEKLYEDKI
jgi:DNA-binding MarR family transcriptional regulator